MSNDPKRQVGRILLQKKLVTQQDVDAALRKEGQPLASQLADSGAVDEIEALRALSEQHGVPGIDLQQVAIHLDVLELVPREVSEAHMVLPVLARGERIFLAMASPTNKRVIDELEFVTGKKVYPYVALTTTLRRTIAAAYDAKASGETYYLAPNVPAETLRQLGLPPRAPATRPAPPPEAPRPTVPAARPDEQELSAVVTDDAVKRAGDEGDLSMTDFGNMSSEVSSVAMLPDELRVAAGRGAVPTGAGKLVLVVDDEEDIRKLLKRVLEGKGFRVMEADRGQLALRMVKEHVPDLIVLDAMLPELHGFDIARRIKGSEKYGSIPIIMVSAIYKGKIADDLKANYGIEEYLEKPFRIGDVVATIQRLLAERESLPKSAAKANPEDLSADAEAALNAGIAAYKAGDIDVAITHLQRGIMIDPLAYRLHYHLALLYGKRGNVFEGISELEKATDLNPRHFPALKNLGVLYEKAGFRQKAVEVWERAALAAPDDETRVSIRDHIVELRR